jgi:putative transposase
MRLNSDTREMQAAMLALEYKLRGRMAQFAAIDEAIRTVQFIRNTCLRLWIDGHSVTANDLQAYCAILAHEHHFVARFNSQARQQAADRPWAAIARFYAKCRAHTPGPKGYPRFQRHRRSVERKVTGWKLKTEGKHISFTDGHGIGWLRLVGTCYIEIVPRKQTKRVRLIRRADGYYVQFCVAVERSPMVHMSIGRHLGIATWACTSSSPIRRVRASPIPLLTSGREAAKAPLWARLAQSVGIEESPESLNAVGQSVSACSAAA